VRAERSPAAVWRIRHAAVCLLLTAFAFNSASGSQVPDTKLDLIVDPVAFLARALHMWDPQGFAGQVQNQAYGYLFPMGPFFALGHAAGLPMWAVQRLWWSALLCSAFLGVVALARRLGIGTPAARLVGGLAFALSPHVLSVVGPVSAEALPMCVAPWVLVPLVSAARDGSPRRAAMRSGFAVLCMGAINAALVLAALVPAVLWFLTRRPDRQLRRLAGAWLLAVVLATSWWVGPLLLFGRYTAPFLGHIEAAPTTTSTATLVETLRGTSDWVAYLPATGWHAGSLLLTQPAAIVNTVAVVALGLAGLALRSTPERTWLVTTLAAGVVLVCAGRVGGVDGLLAGDLRDLLDGVLAPLRNVHKFDVALRLPLTLGLVHLVGRLRWGALPAERRVSRVVVTLVAAGAVAGAAIPLLALRLAPSGTFSSVPDYWRQTADYLAARHATGRALLLPGSRFGQYVWGAPGDEPLQTLARSPWDVRDAVPLSDAGHVRMLDAVDEQLAGGQPSPGLAGYLARSGVQYLVIRNDLDAPIAQTPRPVLVHQALAGSPGLSLVQSFGPVVGGDTVPGGVLDQHLELPYRAVDVYAVDVFGEHRVQATPLGSTVQVSGGPESLLPLSNAGLPYTTPAVLTGDAPRWYRSNRVALTDGLRRREIDNGTSPLSTSATLTLNDPLRMAGHPARDYLPFAGAAHQSYARLIGARRIVASSSASDPNSYGGSVPGDQPYAAFDGDPQTAWRSNPATTGTGQWLELDFTSGREVDSATAVFTADSSASVVAVTTHAGTAVTQVTGTGPIPLAVVPGWTRSLRLSVLAVTGRRGLLHEIGVAELAVPGVTVQRTIVMPRDLRSGTAVQDVSMTAPTDQRNGCVLVGTRPLCTADTAQPGEEGEGIDRSFDLPAAGRYAISVTATPRPGPALDLVTGVAAPPRLTVSASSRAIADPLAGPQAAADGDLGTGWIASPTDPAPTLTLHWNGKRRVSGLSIITDPFLAATRPDRVTIRAPDARPRTAAVAANGAVTFRALTTDQLTLTLDNSTGLQLNYDPFRHTLSRLGLGVSEVVMPGVRPTSRARTDATRVDLPCGTGPQVLIDGSARPTAVATTVGALRDLQPVTVIVCGRPEVDLAAGPHRVRALSTAAWTVAGVDLHEPSWPGASVRPVPSVPVSVRTWGSTDRTVSVGARRTATLLVVHENANSGWRASLAGHTLRRITVDGWQQGYVLPPGPRGLVHLDFTPDRLYRGALLGGAAAVLLLLALAFLPSRRGGGSHRAGAPLVRWRRRDVGIAALAVAAILGLGAVLIVAAIALAWRRRPSGLRRWVTAALPAAGALAVALLTCGVLGAAIWAGVLALALALDVRAAVAPFLRRAMAVVAAGSYVAAGLVLAAHHWGTPGYAAGSATVQALSLTALLAVLLATLRAPWRVAPADDRGPTPAAPSPAAPRTGT
jgi:arabinofuranan 3-O-arabinosyltransferase